MHMLPRSLMFMWYILEQTMSWHARRDTATDLVWNVSFGALNLWRGSATRAAWAGVTDSRIVVRKVDVHLEQTAFVHAPFRPWDRCLPVEKVVVRGHERDVAEVLFLQVSNLAVYPFDGRLAVRQYVACSLQ